MYRKTVFLALVAASMAFAGVGCDFNPTAPFAGFDGEGGATLHGQFQQTGTATALRTMGSTGLSQLAQVSASTIEAVEVIVLDFDDNEIASVEIKDGAFTLRGLPENFKLQFLDANEIPLGEPIEFLAVKPNQEIDIVVAVDDNGSVMILEERRTGIDHEGGSGIELEGVAGNITIDSTEDPMTGSLDVYTPERHHVLTSVGETSIRKGNRSLTLEDLDPGDRVHVRGVRDGEDVFAYEIKLQEEEEDDTAPDTCNVVDPEKPQHILVCHKGRTLSIAPDAWPGHHGHGDTCGPCE